MKAELSGKYNIMCVVPTVLLKNKTSISKKKR
jgi:hypothetical protein